MNARDRLERSCGPQTPAELISDLDDYRAEVRAETLREGLTDTERQFLTFALDLAADQMASRGDEFNADDEAALESLRRMAAEAATGGAK